MAKPIDRQVSLYFSGKWKKMVIIDGSIYCISQAYKLEPFDRVHAGQLLKEEMRETNSRYHFMLYKANRTDEAEERGALRKVAKTEVLEQCDKLAEMWHVFKMYGQPHRVVPDSRFQLIEDMPVMKKNTKKSAKKNKKEPVKTKVRSHKHEDSSVMPN